MQIQKALFLGVLVALVAVIAFTSLISSASVAQAAGQAASASATIGQDVAANSSQNDCGISLQFPDSIRQWCSLIQTYSQKYSIDAQLIASVMLQESGGDPNAYSVSGAVGLMQVMPRDGLAADFQCSGRPCFASRPSMSDLYDPEYNISYGARMLAGLIEKLGSVRDALKAYGPANVGYYYADKVLAIVSNYQ